MSYPLFKVFATDVVISKGFDNTPALRFSEKGDFVRFRIGKKVYDTRAENNTRWVNFSVKAFDPVCDRIKKMKLKEGSFVHIVGTLDEETWTDQATGEARSQTVIILDEIEYASGGQSKPKEEQKPVQQNETPAKPKQEPSPNFTGYEAFGGGGSFFDTNI